MARLQHVATVLEELGRELGLAGLALDKTDSATLSFDELPVTLSYRTAPSETLLLQVEIGEIPGGDVADAAAAFLLQLGFATWASGRMALGLDDDSRMVVGQLPVPVVLLDAAALKRTLVDMVEIALPLAERLANHDFRLDLPGEGGGPSLPIDTLRV